MRTRLRAAIAALLAIALLAACGGTDASQAEAEGQPVGIGQGEPADPDAAASDDAVDDAAGDDAEGEADAAGEGLEVTLATLAPSALLWLHYIADAEGLYAEHGVAVRPVTVSDSPALVQAVSSGSADAGVSLGDNVIRAVDEGADITITGAILGRTILRLIANEGYDEVSDLAGTRLTAGAVEGGTANLLLYMLQEGGVDRGDVELVALPNSRDRLVGMQSDEIQGALLIAPFDAQALDEGATDLGVYTEPYVQTPLIVNNGWAEQNPEAAAGLTKALAEAADWIYEPGNRDRAVEVLADATDLEDDLVQASYDFIVEEQQAISPGLEVPEGGLANIAEIDEAVAGTPADDFDESTYVDPSYLD